LVDDYLRFDFGDAIVDSLRVESVEDDGSCTEVLYEAGVRGVAEGTEDFMLLDEKGDEGLTYGSGCSREKYSHSARPPSGLMDAVEEMMLCLWAGTVSVSRG
jgi:hypothetical protein